MKKLVTIFLITLLALGAWACNGPEKQDDSSELDTAPGPSSPVEREKVENDIREAVFRWQMENNHSGGGMNIPGYFLQLEDKKDPSDEFMKRFSGHELDLKKASERPEKKPGYVTFIIDSITWVTDTQVSVKGGYYQGPRSASGNTYILELENGSWKVKKDTLDWIS